MPDNTDTTNTNTTQQEPAQGATPQHAQSQPPADTGEPHGDPAPDTIDWKAQARKWEKLAKANREKAEQADQLRRGKITDPNAGYLATSFDAGEHGVGVRPGEGVRIRILLLHGTHRAYLQNVAQVKEEHGILLPRGVKLRIIDHGIDEGHGRWVRAVLVSDGQS